MEQTEMFPQKVTVTSHKGYSQSMLTTAQQCEYKYKLKYIDNIKEPGLESAPMNFGTAIHLAINSCLVKDTDPLETFHTYWESMKNKEMQYARNDWEQYAILGDTYITRFQRLHAHKFEIFSSEETLSTSIEDVPLTGTPDFIGYHEGIPCVLDFKTSSKPYTKDKLYTHPQLYLYDILAQKCLGFKATHLGYIVFVSHPEPRIQTIIEPINHTTYNSMVVTIKEWGNRLKTAKEYPRNNNGCLSPYPCQFMSTCWPSQQ